MMKGTERCTALPRAFRPLRTIAPRGRACFLIATVAVISFLAAPAFCQQAQPVNWLEASGSTNEVPTDQLFAQNDSQNTNTSSPQASQEGGIRPLSKKNDRMFFVMPNYLSVQTESERSPVTWKQKFSLAAKSAFDPYDFVIAGGLAGMRQAANTYPGFGQGMEGYSKRYGTAFADQVDSTIMVGGVFPAILKTDPRYFQLGKGRTVVRLVYAFTRTFITHTDSGHLLFNFPEFLGNATSITISNAYYPEADRGFSASAHNWGVQMGIDAFGNVLKEFWPDIHRHLVKKKKVATSPDSP